MSGIIGAYSINGEGVMDELLYGLAVIQHRGGERGCGLGIEDPSDFREPFSTEISPDGIVSNLSTFYLEHKDENPFSGVGNVLYEKTGGFQPTGHWNQFEDGGEYNFSLSMDGVILGHGARDEQIMKGILSSAMKKNKIERPSDFRPVCEEIMEKLDGRGYYSVVVDVKVDNEYYMLAFRDPKGVKPMCWGEKKDEGDYKILFASESVALDINRAKLTGDVKPGQAIVVNKDGIEDLGILKEDKHAHDSFEFVYFAHPNSIIEGRNVYEVRKKLGRNLTKRYIDILDDIDIITCSPDSGRGAMIGVQQAIYDLRGRFVPIEEGIVKTQGAPKTFQLEYEVERELRKGMKFTVNPVILRGKRILIVDDSLVRATVARAMIGKLKNVGVKEAILALSSPPLKHACIRAKKGKEFAAQGRDGDIESIGMQIANDTLLFPGERFDGIIYPTIEDLVDAIEIDDLCTACFSGEYPIDEDLIRN